MLVETRGNDGTRKDRSDFFSAILNPKVSFGGLWTPKSLPKLNLSEIENLSYSALTAHIFKKIGIDSAINLDAYKNFDDKNLPLSYTRIAPNAFLQNLFSGPTRAFKDMAMQPFGALLCDLAKKRREKYLILTATSGDTGPATLEAIKDRENIFGICMFPKDGTSAVQRRQMTTIDAKNIAVLEILGDFDATQNALKNLLNDAEFGAFLESQNLHLSASNSVNFGRIAFQIIYHAYNYIFLRQNDALANGEKFSIVVPSGNFGNALGAFYAKLMGIPIAKIIIATNANCVLKDFISSGIYDLRNRALIKTNSPAMDILKSSNVERVLFALFGAERTKELMSDLDAQKYYELRSDELARLQEFFSAYSFDDDAVCATIRRYAEQNIIIDPHTANAILGANSASRSDFLGSNAESSLDSANEKIIICATAEWVKFVPTIKSALDSANRAPINAKNAESNAKNAESVRDSSPTAQNDKIMDYNADSANFDEKEAMQEIAQKFNLKIHKNIINLFDKDEKNCTKLKENEIKKAIISMCNKFLEN